MEPRELTPADIEKVAECMHENWRKKKADGGVTSRPDAVTGEELMRPYSELSEAAKDNNRGPARDVVASIQRLGFTITRGAQ